MVVYYGKLRTAMLLPGVSPHIPLVATVFCDSSVLINGFAFALSLPPV